MTNRLLSLDALRGFDMLLIMGMTALITQLVAAFGFPCEGLTRQFVHAEWDGLRLEDTIFPLFLFLAGVSWSFALAKRRERGETTGRILRKVLTRGVLLVLLGFIYNGALKFDFVNMTWGAVLTRIGVAWAVAAFLGVFMSARSLAVCAGAILLGYGIVSVLIPAPDAMGADPLSPSGCLAGWVDRLLMPGRLTRPGVISNQGIFSTVPAVVTAILGILAGRLLRREDLSGDRKSAYLALAGVILTLAGCVVAFGLGRFSIPFNKTLWSSSFTLVVGGYSAAMLALFHWLIDVRHWWRHTLFLRVIGMNAITIYLANRIMGFGGIAAFFCGGVAELLPAAWGQVVLTAATILFEWLFLYVLYRKQVFLRV